MAGQCLSGCALGARPVFDRTFPGQHLINQQPPSSLLDAGGNPSIRRHQHQLCPAGEEARESDSCTATARGDSNALATAPRESSSQLLLGSRVLPHRPGESVWERQVVITASETAGMGKAAAGLMANSLARQARPTSKGSCSPNKPKISTAAGAALRGQRQLEYWGPGECDPFHRSFRW